MAFLDEAGLEHYNELIQGQISAINEDLSQMDEKLGRIESLNLFNYATMSPNTILLADGSTRAESTNKSVANIKDTFTLREPRITFIDDDGAIEFYQYFLPIMKKYGLPMCPAYMGDAYPHFVNPYGIENIMTKPMCDEVVEAGGEIVVHYYRNAVSMPLEQAKEMILKSQKAIIDNGFESGARVLVYSDGDSNEAIRSFASEHFDCGFKGDNRYNLPTLRTNKDCVGHFFIHREHVGGFYHDTSSCNLDYFKGLIDECITNNSWLVFITHSWKMVDGAKEPEYENINQIQLLDDVCAYIKSKYATTNLRVVTASEGFKMFGNAVQMGDYLGAYNENSQIHVHFGSAVNKMGQYDFPIANKIEH